MCRFKMAKYGMVLAALCVWSYAPAIAWATGDGAAVAVVPLDENPGSRKTANRMAEVLVAGGREVMYGEQVFTRIAESRVEIAPDAAARFHGIAERVARGVKAFFYEGYSQAIDELAPLVQLGIQHFPYVAQRPDIAAQLYEAGLILIRAYLGTERPEDARATARLLVAYYPAQEPTLDSSPPEIIEMIRAARSSVENDEARLGLKPLGDGACNAFLNGTRVEDGFFSVPAGKPVFVQTECDGERGPLWKVSLASGARVIAPVPMHDLASLDMPDDSFRSRRRTEELMTAVQFWGRFGELVGIRHPDTEGDAPTLFGHLKEGAITWTETNDVPALVGYVERAFDVETKTAYATWEGETATSEPADWLGWGLVGTGVGATAGGIVLLLEGKSDEHALICSGFASEFPAPGDCDGVENLGALTRQEFADRVTAADTKLVAGYSLVALGAGALGYGIFRLVAGASDAEVTVMPTGDAIHVGWSTRF